MSVTEYSNFRIISKSQDATCSLPCREPPSLLCRVWERWAKLEVTAVIETLIQKYAHADYDKTVNSYPSGICSTCKWSLYKCSMQEKKEETVTPQIEWSSFRLSIQ